MTTPTPADELKTAAATLRKLADDATPGPWTTDTSIPYGHRVGSTDEADWIAWAGEHGETRSEADAAYIAAMHPGVGALLTDWLEAAAQQEAYTLAEFGHRGGAGPHALAIARAINAASAP